MAGVIGRELGITELKVLAEVTGGESAAAKIARRARLSVRSVIRAVARLRSAGYRIAAVRENGSWHYELRSRRGNFGEDPALRIVGIALEGGPPDLSERHDAYLYGDPG